MKRNNRKQKAGKNRKQVKVVRCGVLCRPMFEYEICQEFKLKEGASDKQQNCKGCIHSFWLPISY